MKNVWMTAAAAAVMTAAFSLNAMAGEWVQDGEKYRYQNDSGSYAREQIMNIDGVNYGFDKEAYMMSGWNVVDSKWYYFEPNGAMALGWKQLGEDWYYLNPDNGGVMQTSWLYIGSSLYHFQDSGAMQKPNTRFYVNSFGYETDATGAVKRNTWEDKGDGRIFIYDPDGKMKYTNNTLKTGNKAGGADVYTYLLEGDLNEQTKADTQMIITDEIEYRKEELYEEYKEKVVPETRTKSRAKKQGDWEAKAGRRLGELGVSQEEINAYIAEVESGRYGRKDDWGDDPDYEDEYDYDSYYDYD